MDFSGKSVIVTGGGTGVGRAVSLLLARKGASVAVVYSKSREETERTVRDICDQGARGIALKTDVADDGQVRRMVDTVAETFGSVDFLVNNAGITRKLPFEDLELITDELWSLLFSVNVQGAFHCARAAAPHMRKAGGGGIVNIGSTAGLTGRGSCLAYAVSKSAVHGLTKSLAHALCPDIRVNCVVPGGIDTRWWGDDEGAKKAAAESLPLGRIAPPEDIAELVLALLANRSMTGKFVVADNGQTL